MRQPFFFLYLETNLEEQRSIPLSFFYCYFFNNCIQIWESKDPFFGFHFQENLLRTMTALEDTYFTMAAKWEEDGRRNCLVYIENRSVYCSILIDRYNFYYLY